MESPEKDTIHVLFGMDDATLKCYNCGQRVIPRLPAPVDEFVMECNEFLDRHKDCKPSINMDNQDKTS